MPRKAKPLPLPLVDPASHPPPGFRAMLIRRVKKQHAKALKLSKVRPFVLYSMRHTFLTRLGESGCDVWTLARIAGHSSIAISARYVHPSEDAVLTAISRLGGHNSGHNAIQQDSQAQERLLLTSTTGAR